MMLLLYNKTMAMTVLLIFVSMMPGSVSSKADQAPLLSELSVQVETPDLVVLYKCVRTHKLPYLAGGRIEGEKELKGHEGSCYSI